MEAESLDERHHVDEVPSLGTVEQREQLVGRQLFEEQGRPERPVIDRTDRGVCCQVHLGHFAPVRDGQSGEPVSDALATDVEARGTQRRLDRCSSRSTSSADGPK